MKIGICKAFAFLGCLAVILTAGSSRATLVTIDQYIYENAAGVNSALLSGTLDVTASGNTLTLLLTNTSPDAAFTSASNPSVMLLTGIGLQLPGLNVAGGTVSVPLGESAVNFDIGQSTSNISNQWLYANQAIAGWNLSGVLSVDTTMSSVQNGQGTRFAPAPPVNINGPGYGAISALETQFGSSTPGVQDTIKIVLTLNGLAPSAATIDAGNVVVAFGSPNAVPESGSTLVLLGGALISVVFLRRRFGKGLS